MPALNFKKQFAPAVESGEKLQTIRARRQDGRDPVAGQTLYLYTGMRTKGCRKIGEVICKETQQITIEENGMIIIGTHQLCVGEEENLARADGFKSAAQFRDFFRDTHGLPFHGLIIKWNKTFYYQVRTKSEKGDSVVFKLNSEAHTAVDWSLVKETAQYIYDEGHDISWDIKYPTEFEFFSMDDMPLGKYKINLDLIPHFDVESINPQAAKELELSNIS